LTAHIQTCRSVSSFGLSVYHLQSLVGLCWLFWTRVALCHPSASVTATAILKIVGGGGVPTAYDRRRHNFDIEMSG